MYEVHGVCGMLQLALHDRSTPQFLQQSCGRRTAGSAVSRGMHMNSAISVQVSAATMWIWRRRQSAI